MKVSTVERNKSRESNPVVHTVSYAKVMRRKILPNELIEKHLGYQCATFVHQNPSYSQSCPYDLPVGGMCINSIKWTEIFSTLNVVVNLMLIYLEFQSLYGNNMNFKPSSLLMIL